MINYRFSGRHINGRRIVGDIRARDIDHLESKLAERSILLDTCYQSSSDWYRKIHAFFKKNEITRLTRQLQVLISSGISVLEATASVREQIDDKKLGAVFDQIISSIESGRALYEAFGCHPAYFDNLYISLLEAGEVSGTLATSLERIASYREKSETINKKIKSALAYPALVVLVSGVVLFVLITYIIPIFSSMYTNFGLELPALTRNLINAGDFLKNSALYTVISLLILVASIFFISQTEKSRITMGKFLIRIPLIKSLGVKLATSRFCRTLGTLLNSGLPLMDAVPVSSRTTGNMFFKSRLESIPGKLSRGKPLSESLTELNIFPRTIIRITAAGESTGRLGEMFTKAADFYESEVNTEISILMAIIEPLIILCLGAVVAFILIAMYLPLFDLVGQIGT